MAHQKFTSKVAPEPEPSLIEHDLYLGPQALSEIHAKLNLIISTNAEIRKQINQVVHVQKELKKQVDLIKRVQNEMLPFKDDEVISIQLFSYLVWSFDITFLPSIFSQSKLLPISSEKALMRIEGEIRDSETLLSKLVRIYTYSRYKRSN